MKKLLLLLAILPVLLFSQTRKQRKALEAQKKADLQVISNLKNHTQFFSNKDFAQESSKTDEPALAYIAEQFRAIGIQPKGATGYIQQFKIDDGKQIDSSTSFKVNGTVLTVKKDYFPLPFSASKSVAGMPAMALREKGVPWFADVKDWIEDSTKSDSGLIKTAIKEANRAALKGATALFLYNSSSTADNMHYSKRDKTSPLGIPVVYITSSAYNKYFTDQSQLLDIELNVVIKEATKSVSDVVGFIDNGAITNVLIVTPYDQVREEGEAVAKTTAPGYVITGRSMLIELARMLSKSMAKSNNFTFIGYSSEDSLSKDSKWINNFATTSNANYIINLEHVGRFNQDKGLIITANGISPDLSETIKPIADKNLEVSFNNGAVANLNNRLNIPVLNFVTSADAKSNETPGNINYEGELDIVKFIYRFIEATNDKTKFTVTKNLNASTITNQTSVSVVRLIQPK